MGSQWDLYEKNLFIKANQVIQGLREERTSPKEEPRRAETPNNLTITDAEARYSSRPRSSRPQTGKSTRSHVSWQLKPETPRPASSASQRETKIAAQWTPIGKQVQILTKFPPLAQLEGRLNEIELDVWKFPKPNLGREMPSRCVFAVNQ